MSVRGKRGRLEMATPSAAHAHDGGPAHDSLRQLDLVQDTIS